MRKLYRTVAGHRRIAAGLAVGLAVWLAQPLGSHGISRIVLAWDAGSFVFLGLVGLLILSERLSRMEDDAEAQEEGEWTVFALTLAAILLSLAAIFGEFAGLKDVTPAMRNVRIALVAVTLTLSWLMTHVTFALRYAHEFYDRGRDGRPEGGLNFPKTERPDYLDFIYYSFVLGMTFQVSDVEIETRKFRRLATLHGLVGFLFNTVILALVVNLAAGLV